MRIKFLIFVFSIFLISENTRSTALKEEDTVRVRIWNGEVAAGGKTTSMGHVSIETSKHYISLWPDEKDPNIVYLPKLIAGDTPRPRPLASNALASQLTENDPTKTYDLKLNTKNINYFWEILTKDSEDIKDPTSGVVFFKRLKNIKWFLGGTTELYNKAFPSSGTKPLAFSCSSLSFILLYFGGVEGKIKTTVMQEKLKPYKVLASLINTSMIIYDTSATTSKFYGNIYEKKDYIENFINLLGNAITPKDVDELCSAEKEHQEKEKSISTSSATVNTSSTSSQDNENKSSSWWCTIL